MGKNNGSWWWVIDRSSFSHPLIWGKFDRSSGDEERDNIEIFGVQKEVNQSGESVNQGGKRVERDESNRQTSRFKKLKF